MNGVVGTVDQVNVYPVKSLGGRTVAEARVESAGLVGDRAWAVVDATTGERVTVKTTPALAEIVATGDDEADTITLTEVLGRPVRLERSGEPQVDAAAVHLVSRAAIDRAAAGDVPPGCSGDDPRANLLPGPDPDFRRPLGAPRVCRPRPRRARPDPGAGRDHCGGRAQGGRCPSQGS